MEVVMGSKAPSRILTLGIWLAMLSAAPSVAYAQDAPSPPVRPTIAVLDFDFAAAQERGNVVQRSSRGTPPVRNIDAMNVGKGMADLLVAELVNEGDFRVLERQRMAEVAREQQGGNTARARYLVMGAVTKFSGEQKSKSGAGVVMGLLGLATHKTLTPMMGSLSVKESDANVDLSCRIVDAATGEIVGTATGTGLARRNGLSVGGFGGGRAGMGGGTFNSANADFQATILGEAAAAAVKDVAAGLRTVLLHAQ
jgi:curli biogenesis system outer membrane secretion channel CsgG